MSLALVFANRYGIVMSADRRLLVSLESGNEQMLLTEHASKLFLSTHHRGFSYTGASDLDGGIPTSTIIEATLRETAQKALTIAEELSAVKSSLLKYAGERNVILFAAGQENGHNVALTTNLIHSAITNYCEESECCVAFSGAVDIVRPLVDALPNLRDKFPLPEAVSYLKFLTRSVASLQHYSVTPQTVGLECDVLVIQNGMASWANREPER